MARRKHGSELLRQWREKNGMTQEQAGKHLGISDVEVCFYERRHRKPGDKRRVLIEKKCGIPYMSWVE